MALSPWALTSFALSGAQLARAAVAGGEWRAPPFFSRCEMPTSIEETITITLNFIGELWGGAFVRYIQASMVIMLSFLIWAGYRRTIEQ